MSDEEQIARLTELAKKVWNPRHHGIEVCRTGNFASVSTDGGRQPLLEIHFHERAFDALDAALLVLAGEDRYESTMQYAKAMQERAEKAEAERAELLDALGKQALVEHGRDGVPQESERPWYRYVLCTLGWHCTEPYDNGQKHMCVFCGTWDYWDDWVGPIFPCCRRRSKPKEAK